MLILKFKPLHFFIFLNFVTAKKFYISFLFQI